MGQRLRPRPEGFFVLLGLCKHLLDLLFQLVEVVLHSSGCAFPARELLEGLGLSTSAEDECADADLREIRLDVAGGVAGAFARHVVLWAGQAS